MLKHCSLSHSEILLIFDIKLEETITAVYWEEEYLYDFKIENFFLSKFLFYILNIENMKVKLQFSSVYVLHITL